jgi:hypothetical protein
MRNELRNTKSEDSRGVTNYGGEKMEWKLDKEIKDKISKVAAQTRTAPNKVLNILLAWKLINREL